MNGIVLWECAPPTAPVGTRDECAQPYCWTLFSGLREELNLMTPSSRSATTPSPPNAAPRKKKRWYVPRRVSVSGQDNLFLVWRRQPYTLRAFMRFGSSLPIFFLCVVLLASSLLANNNGNNVVRHPASSSDPHDTPGNLTRTAKVQTRTLTGVILWNLIFKPILRGEGGPCEGGGCGRRGFLCVLRQLLTTLLLWMVLTRDPMWENVFLDGFFRVHIAFSWARFLFRKGRSVCFRALFLFCTVLCTVLFLTRLPSIGLPERSRGKCLSTHSKTQNWWFHSSDDCNCKNGNYPRVVFQQLPFCARKSFSIFHTQALTSWPFCVWFAGAKSILHPSALDWISLVPGE